MSKSGISLTQPPSSSPASTLSFKSAWAKGPPRSLATPSPLSPFSPSTPASTDNVSSPQDTPSPSIQTPEPPPRPKRNPARKESFGGADENIARRPSIRQRSVSPRSRDQPSVGGSLASINPALESPVTGLKSGSIISESKESPELLAITPTPKSVHNTISDAQSTAITASNLPLSPMVASKSRLQVDARPFVPRRPSSAIVIKNTRGEQVDILSLSKSTTSNTPAFSVAVSNPIKIESEADKKRREEVEQTPKLVDTDILPTQPMEDTATPMAKKDSIDTSQELRSIPEALTTHHTYDINVPLTAEPTELTKSPTETSDTSNHLEEESIIEQSTLADNDVTEDWSSQQLEIPVLATSPPTAPLDTGFQLTLPPVLEKPVRERSRRGQSRRGGGGGAAAAAAAAVGDATDTLGNKIARTRSGEPRKRPTPGRLDLSGIPKPATVVTGALADAITNAKPIEDIHRVVYPKDVFGPSKELNEGATDKFRYDRDFLLQFRGLCTERPHGMAELEEIGLEPAEQPAPSRSARRRRSVRSNTDSSVLSPNPTGNTLTVPPTPLVALEEGQSTPTVPITPLSAVMTRTGSRGGRSRKTSGNSGLSATAAIASATPATNTISLSLPILPMTRSRSHGSSRVASSSALPPPSPLERRTKSSTARKRSASTRIEVPPFPASLKSPLGTSVFTPGLFSAFENIKPLEFSENRWVPSSIGSLQTPTLARILTSTSVQESEPPEVVERKVKSLLNKLTLEKFDSISDQIVSWANKSEAETDGSTLALVIKLVFEKATDEATWSQMYARLCRKMMEQLSMDVTDDMVRDKSGNPIKGGLLFRHHLLSRCQTEFERGWSTREILEEQQSAVVAASGAAPGEIVFSDEYYALQKAKRRGLGLVKFIGELFKLQMLTERIMHRCILKLLDDPAEEDIESVCQLLKTVGAALSGAKGKESMDMYFGKMQQLSQGTAVSQRIRFMLLDVIELRSRNWIPKLEVAAPSTLAQVHEAASKDENEKSSSSKLAPMSRGSSRRGQNRSQPGKKREQDGQTDRSVGKALGATLGSNLGSLNTVDESTRVSKSPPRGLAPANAHSLSRLASEPGTSRMSRNPSEPGKSRSRRGGENKQVNRRTSVDFAQLDAAIDSSSSGRKRLQLLPRTVGTTATTSMEPETPLAATVEEPPAMTEEQALTKINEDLKEFMQIRDMNEATGYFEALPSEHRHLLVDKFVGKIDAKESDITLVVELFTRVSTSGICTPETFERGFAPTIENLDDIAVDVPTAYTVMADMLRASKLQRDTVERLASGIAVYGQPIVHPREKLMRAFDADI